MSIKLFFQALTKFFIGLILVAALIFLPAWTLDFFNGRLFIIILFVPMFIAGIVMTFRAPELLKKRLSAKEEESEQKAVVALSALMFAAAFVCAGLDHRFGWTHVPLPAVWAAVVVFLLGYVMYAEVMRENAYLSRTVEVQDDQKVIDTGLYGMVRHPMYSSTLLLFLSSGLVLGSFITFAITLFYIPIIAKRIRNEEKVLEEGLPGYKEYRGRVKYKVIPFVW